MFLRRSLPPAHIMKGRVRPERCCKAWIAPWFNRIEQKRASADADILTTLLGDRFNQSHALRREESDMANQRPARRMLASLRRYHVSAAGVERYASF